MSDSNEPQARIAQHLLASAGVLRDTAQLCAGTIEAVAERIAESFRAGGKLLICGNGGSAAESQHLAAEFTHRLSARTIRPALPALALTTDTSLLTAYANDCGFDGVFARQVEALGRSGDVLLGLSTSGNSSNVLQAFRVAQRLGLTSVALMGRAGELQRLADIAICIPSDDTQHIQEAHLAVIHLVCALVEREFAAVPLVEDDSTMQSADAHPVPLVAAVP